ncbi:dTDP-6-deoxy-3,4-keto-hexulose isomerase [Spirochaetia bacterium]|nr:dTDP-6-deoxy-3,4-keto-hexulose isomerase [Spirochaetia bacterium]
MIKKGGILDDGAPPPHVISVFDCSYIELDKRASEKGNLTVVENALHIPFEAKRIFYLYDIPGGESRGAHAHKECHQFLVAASGAFEVALDDGKAKRTVLLNRPYYGLHIPPGIWAAEQGFSSGSICLVLASQEYNAKDYIREYQDFLEWKNI